MKKIPCIKYNPNTWDYIKEQLESFGYKEALLNDNWTINPYIVINLANILGNYSNVDENDKLCHNREIVNNTEEFLERAAKLMNKTYKRKYIMKINGIEIKPGMVLEGLNCDSQDITLIVIQLKDNLGFANISKGGWTLNYKNYIDYLMKIRDISKGNRINNGEILWEYKKEIILTIKEIADKFGYDVNQIKIKL